MNLRVFVYILLVTFIILCIVAIIVLSLEANPFTNNYVDEKDVNKNVLVLSDKVPLKSSIAQQYEKQSGDSSGEKLTVFYGTFNGSLVKTKKGNWLTLGRHSNVTHKNPPFIVPLPIHTIAVWSNLNVKSNILNIDEWKEVENYKQPSKTLKVVGPEDCRMFYYLSECYSIFTTEYKGKNQMFICKLIVEEDENFINKVSFDDKMVRLVCKEYDTQHYTQKNWTPFILEDKFYIIYAAGKYLVILNCNLKTGECNTYSKALSLCNTSTIRKSLVLGMNKDSVLVLGHVKQQGSPFFYSSVFYLFTRNYPHTIYRVSKPFQIFLKKFTYDDFEYVMSAILLENEIIISGGIGDTDVFYSRIPLYVLANLVADNSDEEEFLTLDQWKSFVEK